MDSNGSSSPPSSRRRRWLFGALSVCAAASVGAIALVAFRRWRRRRAAEEHSLPLPSSYLSRFDYSCRDVYVLFPSTVEAEREKHYAVMAAAHLPGASNLLLAPQDAQKKACTYGLDDSEAELLPCLQLLKPRSLQFQHVSLDSFPHLFDGWSQQRRRDAIILNLCDGTELDGIPGISVLRFLRASGVAYTGADEDFFVLSTYKVRMKRRFQQRHVATAPWRILEKEELAEWKQWREEEEKSGAKPTESSVSSPAAASSPDRPAHAQIRRPSPFESRFSSRLSTALRELRALPFPLLVKPDDSYCSCGITTRGVVFDAEAACDYASSIAADFSAVFVEQFVKGREFTVFVAGDARNIAQQLPEDLSTVSMDQLARVLQSQSATSKVPFGSSSASTSSSSGDDDGPLLVLAPVERAFDPSLPFWEQFISYELFWEIARNSGGKDEFVFKPVDEKEGFPQPTHHRPQQQQTSSATAAATPLSPQLSLFHALQAEALRAYISVGGCGYARVDVRYDPVSGRLAVLEVNANCGITQYKQTAMGEILRESKWGFYQLLDAFLQDATRNTNDAADPSHIRALSQQL